MSEDIGSDGSWWIRGPSARPVTGNMWRHLIGWFFDILADRTTSTTATRQDDRWKWEGRAPCDKMTQEREEMYSLCHLTWSGCSAVENVFVALSDESNLHKYIYMYFLHLLHMCETTTNFLQERCFSSFTGVQIYQKLCAAEICPLQISTFILSHVFNANTKINS